MYIVAKTKNQPFFLKSVKFDCITPLKLAFFKAASYHPPYLTPTQQIFPHVPVQVMLYSDDITITSTHEEHECC